jgi:hypothetical protein
MLSQDIKTILWRKQGGMRASISEGQRMDTLQEWESITEKEEQ